MLSGQIAGRTRRTIPAVALIISAAVAVSILAARNLYDDEILSLPIITVTARQIIQFASSSDVHPPGMYLLAHFALHFLPSFRWMNLVPTAVLYAGLAGFVISFAPRFRSSTSRTLFLVVAAFHPQLLLWGTSYRWYSWWNGIALITLVIALQPRRSDPSLSIARSGVIGALLATLFYINYITLFFAVALALAMKFRYGRVTVSQRARAALVVTALFAIFISPQVRTVTAQLARSDSQRSGILTSFVRLLQATLGSEAYLPWHPLAVVMASVFLFALAAGFWRETRPSIDDPTEESQRPLRSIAIFTAIFFLLVALSGLGGRPRNGLLLVPTFAVTLAYAANRLPARFHQVLIILIALWSGVGIRHMMNRTGLAKSMMIDHAEQVTAFIHSTARDGCAVLVTYDASLTYAVSHARGPRTVLLSQFPEPIAQSANTLAPDCSHAVLYVAYSYIVGNGDWAARIKSELDSAARLITGPVTTASFSFDPDAARKRAVARLPGVGRDLATAARLPDYRYTLVAGTFETSAMPELRSRLPDFCTANVCRSPVTANSR